MYTILCKFQQKIIRYFILCKYFTGRNTKKQLPSSRSQVGMYIGERTCTQIHWPKNKAFSKEEVHCFITV